MVQSFSRFSMNGDIIKYEYHIFQNGILKKVRFRIGGQMWNSLPENLRSAKSKSILKRNPSVDVKSSLLLSF